MLLQIHNGMRDLFQVHRRTFTLTGNRPVAALVAARIKILRQQLRQCRLAHFLNKLVALFPQLRYPALQVGNQFSDSQQRTVYLLDLPIEISHIRLDPAFLHLRHSGTKMNCRSQVNALSLEGTEIDALRPVVPFQIIIRDDFPAVTPDLRFTLIVPIDGIFLVAFPVAGWKSDALTVFIKVINLFAFRKPFPLLIHSSHSQHDVRVGIAVAFVVNSKVHAHPMGNKMLPAEVLQHGRILVSRDFTRERQNDAAGKL